jgi:hypothetical protein
VAGSYIEKDVRTHKSVREQHEGVLMHYNELQLRSAEVEAMGMDFQKRVAGAVAKAGFRQKPGPKKKARGSGGAEPMAIGSMPRVRRASGVAGVEKQTPAAKAAPRKLTEVAKDKFRETMEVKHREELARLGPP